MFSHVLLALMISAAPSLAGKWGGEGEVFFDLRDGGKGKMEDESIKWEVKGDKLVITDSEGDSEEIPFSLKGDRLTIKIDDLELHLHRVTAPAAVDGPKPGQLERILLAIPWCSKTMRMSFSADGAWTMTNLQKPEMTTGRWAIKKNQLHMSNPPAAPELLPVRLHVGQTETGEPTLNANGTDYSACKP